MLFTAKQQLSSILPRSVFAKICMHSYLGFSPKPKPSLQACLSFEKRVSTRNQRPAFQGGGETTEIKKPDGASLGTSSAKGDSKQKTTIFSFHKCLLQDKFGAKDRRHLGVQSSFMACCATECQKSMRSILVQKLFPYQNCLYTFILR